MCVLQHASEGQELQEDTRGRGQGLGKRGSGGGHQAASAGGGDSPAGAVGDAAAGRDRGADDPPWQAAGEGRDRDGFYLSNQFFSIMEKQLKVN